MTDLKAAQEYANKASEELQVKVKEIEADFASKFQDVRLNICVTNSDWINRQSPQNTVSMYVRIDIAKTKKEEVL